MRLGLLCCCADYHRRVTDLAGIDLLRFLWVDNANVIRSKSVPITGERVDLDRAVRISQAQYALPVYADVVIEQTGLLPTHDVTLVPDWTSLRRFDDGQAAVHCDIADGERPWGHCPRTFLRRMDQRATAAGMQVRAGSELEFTLLRDGAPIDTSAYAQDSAFDADAQVIGEVLRTLRAQGVQVAQCHPESGPGQWEISLRAAGVVAAADAIVAVRQVVRAVATRHGMSVDNLPLVTPDGVGAGMHVHMSFTGDPSDGFGPYGNPFIAGVLAQMPTLLAVTAPSPLSLARFRPRYWAGAFLGWGVENKEAPLRVVLTDGGQPRDVEYKSADITANPYLLLGCLLAAGLNGVEQGMSLPPAMQGDPGLLSAEQRSAAGLVPMPTDALAVLEAFEGSDLFRHQMGPLHGSYAAVSRASLEHMREMAFDEVVAVMVDRI